jgi:hypothetical protein
MKTRFVAFSVFVLLLFTSVNTSFAQDVTLGPRLSGNFNIYNQTGLVGSYNGIGIGIGGTVDISFSKHIGIMTNLTFFDMRSFSSSNTAQNQTTESSLSLSYLTLDPMFKLEFSGFYIVAGPSLGVKLGSSGTTTVTAAGATPNVTTLNLDTQSVIFDIVAGTGYSFTLTPNSMFMGVDFTVYIPISNTYNFPGTPNSVLTLKLGCSLKFQL